MRSLIAIAALAAFATLLRAADHQPVKPLLPIDNTPEVAARNDNNATHFTDPTTSQTYRRHACAVHHDQGTEHFKRSIAHLHSTQNSRAVGSRAPKPLVRRQLQQPLTINTYFHVLTTTAKKDTITPQMALDQAAALNAAYKPIGITFNLINTSFTTNDAWAIADGPAMDELKTSLRAGTYADLNIYFHTDLAGAILGTCTLPSKVPPEAPASIYVSDGCNVAAGTMPGGSISGYNKGGTSIHETGHWLGLLHTFEGYSCEGEGDFIDDTPVQSESTNGCPDKPPKDSCPDKAGVDPIHNYMDYSTDVCYQGFSPGQVRRIQTFWNDFRKGV